MIRLSIAERGGQPKPFTFPKDDITIGRAQGNDIILPRNNISKRHTRVFRRGTSLILRDLDSTNGTFLNGRRIQDDEVLGAGDRIFLADFVLIVEEEEGAATPLPPNLKKTAAPPPLSAAGAPLAAPPPLPGDDLPSFAEPEEEVEPETLDGEPDPEPEPLRPTLAEDPSAMALSAADLETAEPDLRLDDLAERARRTPAPAPREPAAPARPSRLATPAPVPREPEPPARPARLATPSPVASSRERKPTPPPASLQERTPVRRPEAPAPEPAKPESLAEALAEAAARPSAPRARPSKTPAAPREPEPRETPAPRPAKPSAPREPEPTPAKRAAARRPAEPLPAGQVRLRVMARVAEVVRLGDADPSAFGDPELQTRIKSALMDELAILEAEDLLDAALDRDALIEEITGALFGTGPFAAAAKDPLVETLVAYPDGSLLERREGRWRRLPPQLDTQALGLLTRRLAAAVRGAPAETFTGVHPDLPGVELSGSCGPAFGGSLVRLDRAPSFPADLDGLADAGLLSVPMGTFLKMCLDARLTVALVGPSASARAALLRALVAALPAEERVAWVGDPGTAPAAAEGRLLIPLTPPSMGELLLQESGETAAGLAALVQWTQAGVAVLEKVDPTRDVPFLRSMRGRLGAVLLGIAADRFEPPAALDRPAGTEGPGTKAGGVDPRLAAAVDIVAEISPLIDGSVRTLRIAERTGEGTDPFASTAIFEFVASGLGEAGELAGEYKPTRAIPRFLERRRARGKRVDLSIFQS